jgi:hypothetical protein
VRGARAWVARICASGGLPQSKWQGWWAVARIHANGSFVSCLVEVQGVGGGLRSYKWQAYSTWQGGAVARIHIRASGGLVSCLVEVARDGWWWFAFTQVAGSIEVGVAIHV